MSQSVISRIPFAAATPAIRLTYSPQESPPKSSPRPQIRSATYRNKGANNSQEICADSRPRIGNRRLPAVRETCTLTRRSSSRTAPPNVLNWNNVTPATENHMLAKTQAARQALDAWTREIIQWHFNPETGCPFWLEYARKLDWDPRREIQTYDDLDRFGFFQDEWLRGGPVRRWVPKAYADRPIYIFETGGSTGVPKSRITIDDFRIDYEAFSDDTARRRLSQGRGLDHGRSQRAAAAAARRRAPGATSRRHLLHGGPGPALGHQADQDAARSTRPSATSST